MIKDRGPILSYLIFLIVLALFLYPRPAELKRAAVDLRTTESSRREILSRLEEGPLLGDAPPAPAAGPAPPPAPGRSGWIDAPGWEPAQLLFTAEACYFAGNYRASLDLIEEIALRPETRSDDLFRCVELANWMREYWLAASIGEAYLRAPGTFPGADRLILLAQIYADAGQRGKAFNLWARISDRSGDLGMRRRAARSAADLDPSPRAIELFRDYLRADPGDSEMRERLARLYQANRNLGDFVRELEILYQANPLREDWRSEIVAVLTVERDYERLRPYLERSIREGKEGEPGQEELYLETLEGTGRVEELVLELRRLLVQAPDDAELLERLGALQESRQWLEEAAECWKRLFELGAGSPELGARSAALFEFKGMWKTAIELYRKLHERFPAEPAWSQKLADLHEPRYERELAHRLGEEKNRAPAREAALHVLMHDPEDPEMLNLAGGIEFDSRDFKAARAHFERLSGLKPEDPEALFMLSEAQSELGDRSAAKESARKVLHLLEALPDTPERELMRTLSHLRLGREAETREGFRKLLAKDPKNADILKRYAWYLLDARDPSELREVLEKWRAVDPQADELHEISGIALRREGRLEEAARELGSSPGQTPSANRALEYAEVLLELGRWKEARSALQEQEPSEPRAARMIERIDATYGPESSGSAQYVSATQSRIERARETTKAFLTEPLWIAEDGRLGQFVGRVAAVGDDEKLDLEELGLVFGYYLTPGLQLFAGGGGWEENGASHAEGMAGADLKGKWGSAWADVQVHRPWDTFVESVAFEGREDRVEAQGESTLGFLHVSGEGRFSRYEVLDLRQLLDRHSFGNEASLVGRVEGRLWSNEDLEFGSGFWDETLRHEEGRTPHLSVVYQYSFDEFLSDPSVLRAIPLVRRSTAHLAGISGCWVESGALLASGEFLVGADPARNLAFGRLYTGTFRTGVVLSRKGLLAADVIYLSEQLKAQGGGSWQFQASLNLNF